MLTLGLSGLTVVNYVSRISWFPFVQQPTGACVSLERKMVVFQCFVKFGAQSSLYRLRGKQKRLGVACNEETHKSCSTTRVVSDLKSKDILVKKE